MIGLAIARALHVLGVVIWIGGVALATLVLFPAIRQGAFAERGAAVFHAIERRFVWFARASVLLVGASGLYMVQELDAWDRFRSIEFWWMHAMVGTWLIFALLLFVGEPLILHRYGEDLIARRPRFAYAVLHAVHAILLILALITIAGAVLGSHGVSFGSLAPQRP